MENNSARIQFERKLYFQFVDSKELYHSSLGSKHLAYLQKYMQFIGVRCMIHVMLKPIDFIDIRA